MNEPTARVQRQLSFPPVAARVERLAMRAVEHGATRGTLRHGGEGRVVATRALAVRLRRWMERRVDELRHTGGRRLVTWYAADCAMADLDNVVWPDVAAYWVGRVVDAMEPTEGMA